MPLVPLPTAAIDDADVTWALRRAVQIINPVVDVLSRADPFGFKGRSHHIGTGDGSLDRALDAVAWVLNTADVPGTQAWAEMDLDARTNWWVRRVGALDTILVAFPGVLGVVADRLPIQDALGFFSQAVVLCAVAREHGIRDHDQQVRLLGAVLCDRELVVHRGPADAGPPVTDEAPADGVPMAPVKALWHTAGVLRAIGGELVKRPRPRAVFRYLGMLPAVGAVADYFGEYGALVRAAKAGRKWIARQPVAAV